jgi:uncharacterized protein (DUF2141 family)
MKVSIVFAVAALAAGVLTAHGAAAELTVDVSGLRSTSGQIGCALFRRAEGFPLDTRGTPQQWVAASGPRVACVFKDIAPGTYAVSVVHDLNGNQRVDTNLFGIPREPWGVSKNAAPSLRAPSFDEARFALDAVTQRIEIALVH